MSDGTKYSHMHMFTSTCDIVYHGAENEESLFWGIIGPILGLFERDSHVEFIYHIFGTSVKTPLCYFHRSLTLPFSDMCCHHLACTLSRAPVNR